MNLADIKQAIADELQDTPINLLIKEVGYKTDAWQMANVSGFNIKTGIRIGGGDPGYANGSVDLGDTHYYGIITEVKFVLAKSGAPTGNMYCRVRDLKDRLLAESSTVLDVSTLGTDFAWKSFSFSSVAIRKKAIRIMLEYSGGDSSNYVEVAQWKELIFSASQKSQIPIRPNQYPVILLPQSLKPCF